jgi:hypothetical protein
MSHGITTTKAADSFFAAIPHAVSAELLQDYGIEATPLQRGQLTLELLLLNVFWIQSALAVALSPQDAARVQAALLDCIHRHWQTTLGLNEQEWPGFTETASERRQEYERIVDEGGSPMAVLTDAAARLVAAAELGDESRAKLLAFLLENVPVDALGEIAAELELRS